MVGKNREFREEVVTDGLTLRIAYRWYVLIGVMKKAPSRRGFFYMKQGDGLLSHLVSKAVPSVLEGLTSVFGKGTGVSPPLWSPSFLRVTKHSLNERSLTTEQRYKR
jgi:hypothetical protein